MVTLSEHIAALNAVKEAWVAEDPTQRWTGLFSDDLEMWAEMGVTTPAEFDRNIDEQTFYEMHREVYSYRPDYSWIKSLSNDALAVEIQRCAEAGKRQELDEAEREAITIAEFETSVTETIALGAADRETALRWLADSEEFECFNLNTLRYDWERFEYMRNLPYGFISNEMKWYKEVA